jgi:hypothetical protein
VLGAVKALNSLELVGETVRHALNVLATVVPEWLKQQVKPEWFDRYGQRMEDYRLRHPTKASVLSSVQQLARMDSFCWLVSNKRRTCNGF